MRAIATLCLVMSCPLPAAFAADSVQTGPAPSWVQALGEDALANAAAAPAGDAAIQILSNDTQLRFLDRSIETYVGSAVRIQTPQGLAAIGTIALSWKPDADVLTVHRLAVRRGSEVKDLLGKGNAFTILRREDRLEYATLTGALTAVTQPPGLQVGDIVELAYTVKHVDPVVADVPDRDIVWPNAPVRQLRFRASWPEGMPMRWQASKSLPQVRETSQGGTHMLALDLRDVEPLPQPVGAPLRYAALRRIEMTTHRSWAALSARLSPLYVNAAELKPDSPLKEEIARIRATHADASSRAAAALALVEDQVRYVFLGMNEGGLVPAPADLTWERRFGDCKAKTALLLALLHGLGIEAEPALVHSSAGDGLDAQLPAVGAFDHVIVRATVDGRTFWLDGTRTGDRRLANLVVPGFGWSLPVRTRNAELVRLVREPLAQPAGERSVEIDASAGLAVPASFKAEAILRGDAAHMVKLSLDNLAKSEREERLRDYWRNSLESIEVRETSYRFDELAGELRLLAQGTIRMDWGDGEYETDGMVLGYKADFTRPEGSDRTAPWMVNHPSYERRVERIVLPPQPRTYSVRGEDYDVTVAGRHLTRRARIEGTVFTAEALDRSIAAEFPASEAADAERKLRELSRKGLYVKKPAGYVQTRAEVEAEAGQTLASAEDYVKRAERLRDSRRPDLAQKDYDRALELQADKASIWAGRAVARFLQNDYRGAHADADKAIALDPRDPSALRALGAVLAVEGNTDRAVELLSASLQIEPDMRAFHWRGAAYMLAGKPELALPDAEEVLKRDPAFFEGRHLRVTSLIAQGREEDAVKAIRSVIDGTRVGYAQAATFWTLMRRPQETRAALTEMIRLEPDASTYARRAAVQTDRASRDADLEAALKLDPKYLPALMDSVRYQLDDHSWDRALATSDQLAQAGQPNWAKGYRAMALVGQGKPDQARELFADVRSSASPAQLNDLCWHKATRNLALDEALKDCDTALQRQPQCAACQDSRGLTLLRLGRAEDALESYDKAIQLAPKQADSLYGRGLAKLRLGRRDEAEADLSAAKGIDRGIEDRYRGYGVAP